MLVTQQETPSELTQQLGTSALQQEASHPDDSSHTPEAQVPKEPAMEGLTEPVVKLPAAAVKLDAAQAPPPEPASAAHGQQDGALPAGSGGTAAVRHPAAAPVAQGDAGKAAVQAPPASGQAGPSAETLGIIERLAAFVQVGAAPSCWSVSAG